MRDARTWSELTAPEQDEVLRHYYSIDVSEAPFVASMPIDTIIEKYALAAKKHSFPQYLPGTDAAEFCEMCREPLELLALNRSECRELGLHLTLGYASSSDLDPVRLVALPGLSTRIPYRDGRTKPCRACRHERGTTNCTCARCKAKYKLEHREKWRRLDAEAELRERERQEAAAARLRERVAHRRELEAVARRLLSTELAEDHRRLAAALIQMCGAVEDDGGLWLTLGIGADLPPQQHDPWSGQPQDAWTVLAHLQVGGLVRHAGAYYREWRAPDDDYRSAVVTRFLVTATPEIAAGLGLVTEPLLAQWRRARGPLGG